MNKKGQITLFIIIGIVLLLTAFIFIYIQGLRDEVKVIDIIDTPIEARPVYTYIDTCFNNFTFQLFKSLRCN